MKMPKILNGSTPWLVRWASWATIIVVALTTVGGYVGVVAATAGKWLTTSITREESLARQAGDALIISQVNALAAKVDLIAVGLQAPVNSDKRHDALAAVPFVRPRPTALPDSAQSPVNKEE